CRIVSRWRTDGEHTHEASPIVASESRDQIAALVEAHLVSRAVPRRSGVHENRPAEHRVAALAKLASRVEHAKIPAGPGRIVGLNTTSEQTRSCDDGGADEFAHGAFPFGRSLIVARARSASRDSSFGSDEKAMTSCALVSGGVLEAYCARSCEFRKP